MLRLLHITDKQEVCDVNSTKTLPDQGYLWLILSREDKFDLAAWIQSMVGKPLHPRHLDDLAQKNHPSYYDFMSDYDVFIFRTALRLEAGVRKGLGSTSFLLFEKLLVTVYDNTDEEFNLTFNAVTDPNRSLPQTPALMLESCLDYTVNKLTEFRTTLETKTSTWQKKLLKVSRGKAMDWTSLLDFKADLRKLKTICEEQNDTLSAWRTSLKSGIKKPYYYTENLLVNLNDVTEHSGRMLNFITQTQGELESLLQLHFTILGHRTNEIMRVIAIITGIFMPANLIAGIYGMNFSSLPEVGTPHGLEHILALMAATTGLALAIFYWLKWL